MEKLQEKYKKIVIPAMMQKFGYKNPMAVPKIVKVTLNTSFGKESVSKTSGERDKLINLISQDLGLISGQKPRLVKSKKSIAGFKLREGLDIAAMVTLRRQKMWDFLERLIYISLPKSRDFKGIERRNIDKGGNLNVGFREHIHFPEIATDKEKSIFGLELTVTTDAKNNEKGLALFALMGFPLKEEKKP